MHVVKLNALKLNVLKYSPSRTPRPTWPQPRYAGSRRFLPAGLLVWLLCMSAAVPGWAALINVPNDHATIQAALDAAGAGDTIEVETGVYNERVTFPADGTAGNPIILTAKIGHTPVIDGTGIAVGGLSGLVYIEDRAYVEVVGFEIRNYRASSGADFPAGVWVRGTSHNVQLRDNIVHHIENNGCGNCGAHGIAVYGTSGASSIHDLLIDGNEVRDCTLGWSESVVLNGNVEDFVVSNNTVHDNNNIGIDMIGFEGECGGCADELDRARDGVVVGNLVYNIDSRGNPAYGNERSADGIYVDGGTRIVIERNVVHDVNIGIELASEHSGKTTSEIIARNNFVYRNHITGIAIGGYNTNRGQTRDCAIVNNTLYENDTDETGLGELLVQYDTLDNTIANNIVVAGSQNLFLVNEYTANSGNVVDYNLYFAAAGGPASGWEWKGDSYSGFASWQASTGNDTNSLFVDPLLADPDNGDLHLTASSPAVNAGDVLAAAVIGDVDIDGDDRVDGASVDIGADELTVCGDGIPDASEECDDGDQVDGDGCDTNCTLTGCGNAITTAGEECDDGNTDDFDCCSSSCLFEGSGSSCDDGVPCTGSDQCDGIGACMGSAAPDPTCWTPAVDSRGSILKLRDHPSGKDRFSWKWGKGPEVTAVALGDPAASDDMVVCVLLDEGSGWTVFNSALAPYGSRWALKGASTWKYKDTSLSPDGLKQIKIKPGIAGKGKVKVRGSGANLGLAGLPLAPAALVAVEMRNVANDACFGAAYTPDFRRNDSERFQAVAD